MRKCERRDGKGEGEKRAEEKDGVEKLGDEEKRDERRGQKEVMQRREEVDKRW